MLRKVKGKRGKGKGERGERQEHFLKSESNCRYDNYNDRFPSEVLKLIANS
jgi:hypothetical protein